MIKKNKWKLLISSIVILCPIIVGCIMWNSLPEQMATHWGIGGEADGWSNRLVAVFGLPVFMLVLHWICIFATTADPKNKDQAKKAIGLVFWICPVISLFANTIIYATAFGVDFNMERIMLIALGLMFVVIGNYLPKCKQNHTLGIRVKWTLENEENWNATHRFGGKVWVIGGLLLLLCIFLPKAALSYALIVCLVILAITPISYSYIYSRKS